MMNPNLIHEVRVRPLLGSGGMGQSWGTIFTTAALVVDEVKLIRNASGAEVVSSSDVYLVEPVKVGSTVTIWLGTTSERQSTVLAVARWDHPSLGTYHVLSLT